MTLEFSAIGGSRAEGIRPEESSGGCRCIEALVAAATGIALADLRAANRGPAPVALARHIALYLAHVNLGLSLSAVGREFGRDRTTVAAACARIEEMRSDPGYARVLDCLERALAGWRQGSADPGSER